MKKAEILKIAHHKNRCYSTLIKQVKNRSYFPNFCIKELQVRNFIGKYYGSISLHPPPIAQNYNFSSENIYTPFALFCTGLKMFCTSSNFPSFRKVIWGGGRAGEIVAPNCCANSEFFCWLKCFNLFQILLYHQKNCLYPSIKNLQGKLLLKLVFLLDNFFFFNSFQVVLTNLQKFRDIKSFSISQRRKFSVDKKNNYFHALDTCNAANSQQGQHLIITDDKMHLKRNFSFSSSSVLGNFDRNDTRSMNYGTISRNFTSHRS